MSASLLAALCATALGGGFGDKTMRGAWAAREVEADLVLPRGRWEFALGGATKTATAVRGAFGIPVAYDDAAFTHSTVALTAATGLSDRTTLRLSVPWVHAHLDNARGAAIDTRALGDATTTVRVQPWLDRRHAAAFEAFVKSPSGMEWPANTRGGAAFTEEFLTGTGTTNAGVAALGRYRTEQVALDGRLAATHKFAGVVGYVVETGGFGNGWLKPGDEVRLDGAATVQLGPDLAVGLSGRARYVGTYLVGVAGPGATKLETYWLGSEEQYTYADGTVGTIETDPSGWFADAGLHLVATPNPGFVLRADATTSLAGADGRFFSHLGLEEFSPHPGLTFGLSGALRW